MDANSDGGLWYSADALAHLSLPGYPRSGRRIHDRATSEGWPMRLVPSQGRNGERREYQPPPEIQALIDARKEGVPIPKKKHTLAQAAEVGRQFAQTLRDAERKQGTVFVNVGLLARLLDAVDAVAERKFKKPLPTIMRLGAAISAYQSMPQYGLPEPLDAVSAHALGNDELEAAVTLALFIMNAEQFEPGQGDDSISIISIVGPVADPLRQAEHK